MFFTHIDDFTWLVSEVCKKSLRVMPYNLSKPIVHYLKVVGEH